jgi:hypothetical protein
MSASFGKREREKKKQERAAEKRERRQERSAQSESQANVVDEAELMERFRVLSERFEAKTISREDYEAERAQIFTELGVADSLA